MVFCGFQMVGYLDSFYSFGKPNGMCPRPILVWFRLVGWEVAHFSWFLVMIIEINGSGNIVFSSSFLLSFALCVFIANCTMFGSYHFYNQFELFLNIFKLFLEPNYIVLMVLFEFSYHIFWTFHEWKLTVFWCIWIIHVGEYMGCVLFFIWKLYYPM